MKRKFTSKASAKKPAAKKRAVKRAAPKKRAVPKKSAKSMAMRKHSVLWNPFGNHRDPKIYDGAALESHGRQFRSVKPIALTENNFTYDFHLFAGLGCNATSARQNSNGNGTSLELFNYGTGGFGTVGMQVGAATGTTNRLLTYSGDVSKWRMLSVGMKLSLLNNDDDNEGWFELIRTNRRWTDNDIQLMEQNNDPIAINSVETVYPIYDPAVAVNGVEFANDTAYIAGPLKDLKNHHFQLKKTDDEHAFINLKNNYSANTTVGASSRVSNVQSSLELNTLIHQHLIDPSFDTITVRIHGRDSAAGGAATTVLVETVSNMEVIYDDSTELAQFMTPNIAMKGTPDVVRSSNMSIN